MQTTSVQTHETCCKQFEEVSGQKIFLVCFIRDVIPKVMDLSACCNSVARGTKEIKEFVKFQITESYYISVAAKLV